MDNYKSFQRNINRVGSQKNAPLVGIDLIGMKLTKKMKAKQKQRTQLKKRKKVILRNLKNFGDSSNKPTKVVRPQYELTEPQKIALRNRMKEWRNIQKECVKLELNEKCGASITVDISERTAIKLDDVRHFITYMQLQHPPKGGLPEWISISNFSKLEKSVVLIVEGVGLSDFELNRDKCPTLAGSLFALEMISPLEYGGTIVQDLLTLPLTKSEVTFIKRKFGTVDNLKSNVGETQRIISEVFRVSKSPMDPAPGWQTASVSRWQKDKFPRTTLLLTPWQMVQSNFPIPIDGSIYSDYRRTKDIYKMVSDQSPMFGLDCEMCLTTKGSELTRVSIVNEDHEIVYERLVKPDSPIINYLTQYSGITREMMWGVSTRLEDVQEEIRKILPANAILIGQSLESDLQALKMMHPYIIDTSVIFNLSGYKDRKTSLRVLALEFLSERIQTGGAKGHDSIEDSLASMKLVQAKLQHYFEWGNKILEGERNPAEAMAARKLLEQRDELENQVFVRKYAKVCICDDNATQKIVHKHRITVPRLPQSERKKIDSDDDKMDLIHATRTLDYICKDRHSVLLHCKEPVYSEYMTFATSSRLDQQKDKGFFSHKIETSNKGVVKAMCEDGKIVRPPIKNNDHQERILVWGHVRFPEGQARNIKDQETCRVQRVSKWLKMLKSSYPIGHSIFIIVLAGSDTSMKGVCFIDTNAPILPSFNDVVNEIKKDF